MFPASTWPSSAWGRHSPSCCPSRHAWFWLQELAHHLHPRLPHLHQSTTPNQAALLCKLVPATEACQLEHNHAGVHRLVQTARRFQRCSLKPCRATSLQLVVLLSSLPSICPVWRSSSCVCLEQHFKGESCSVVRFEGDVTCARACMQHGCVQKALARSKHVCTAKCKLVSIRIQCGTADSPGHVTKSQLMSPPLRRGRIRSW